jgi:predicted ATPase
MTSISKIIIGGFKSIRERTEIPIAPITFLFGPNSAGKSAVRAAMDALVERLRDTHQTSFHAHDLAPPVFKNGRNFSVPITEGDSVPVSLGNMFKTPHPV